MWKIEKASEKTLGTLLIEDPISSFSFVWDVQDKWFSLVNIRKCIAQQYFVHSVLSLPLCCGHKNVMF